MISYEDAVKIDPDNLDVECIRQAELSRQFGKHAAHLRKVAMKAEERVKVVRMELIKKLQDRPEIIGKKKATSTDLEIYYRTHPDHLRAKEEWIQALYEANYAEAAHKAICFDRRASLEGLIGLYLGQYFTGPEMPRNLRRAVDMRLKQDEADDIVSEKMMRRKK